MEAQIMTVLIFISFRQSDTLFFKVSVQILIMVAVQVLTFVTFMVDTIL